MGRFLKLLFQLILSPTHGWEDIQASGESPAELAATGFYPLTAVVALSSFAGWFFHSTASLQHQLVGAIITFIMFFLGYFVGTFSLTTFLEAVVGHRVPASRCRVFALFSMSLLELATLINNLVPFTVVITWFIPIYVAVVMWKGAAYLDVLPADSGKMMLVAVPGVLLPPYLIYFLFSILFK